MVVISMIIVFLIYGKFYSNKLIIFNCFVYYLGIIVGDASTYAKVYYYVRKMVLSTGMTHPKGSIFLSFGVY